MPDAEAGVAEKSNGDVDSDVLYERVGDSGIRPAADPGRWRSSSGDAGFHDTLDVISGNGCRLFADY
jgi:hypothetical protein